MKKNRLVILLAGLVVSAGLIYSCTKEVANSESAVGEKSLKSALIYPSEEGGCSSVCIKPGSGDYFVKANQQIVKWGGKNNDKNAKTVDIEVYNTETDFVLRVKSTNGWSDLVIDGVSSWTKGPVAENVWGEYKIPLTEGWKACDEIKFNLQVAGDGPQATFAVIYNLVGICKDCEESFSYETENNLDVVFEYQSAEDIEGAEVKITCPHIDGYAANDGKSYTVNNTGNQTVLTWIGDIEACTPVVFDLTFTPDCDQNKSGSINIWTDFKVNEASKKGITAPTEFCKSVTDPETGIITEVCEWPIIKYSCPK